MRTLHRALVTFLAAALVGTMAAGPAVAQEAPPLPRQHWNFTGPFGTYDRASEQRGYQVFKQICANCHSLNMAYYRDLTGIGLSPAQIKATAASVMVPGLDASGQPADRPALPADHFRAPFPNELAARAANNGALPPDLSDIVKARVGGADYVYGILTGYSKPPAGMKMSPGMNYNEYYPGHQIAMAQMLRGGEVTFADGSPNTAAAEAHDVVSFLSYISQPEMEQRKRIGVRMVLFLMVMTGLTYAVKRKVWADVEH